MRKEETAVRRLRSGRLGDHAHGTPTDPDVPDYRIPLFSARFRYVTGAERIRGGNG
jgi:hypothetical protein